MLTHTPAKPAALDCVWVHEPQEKYIYISFKGKWFWILGIQKDLGSRILQTTKVQIWSEIFFTKTKNYANKIKDVLCETEHEETKLLKVHKHILLSSAIYTQQSSYSAFTFRTHALSKAGILMPRGTCLFVWCMQTSSHSKAAGFWEVFEGCRPVSECSTTLSACSIVAHEWVKHG